MKKPKKKTIIVAVAVLAIIVVVCVVSITVFNKKTAVLTLGSASGKPGEEVTLNLNLTDNPGTICLSANIEYDTNALELISAESTGEVFPADTLITSANTSDIPYIMTWEDGLNPNRTANGNLAVLTFKIKENAVSDKYPVTLKVSDFYNFDLNDCGIKTSQSYITIK